MNRHRLLAGEGTVYFAISEGMRSWDERVLGGKLCSRRAGTPQSLRCDRPRAMDKSSEDRACECGAAPAALPTPRWFGLKPALYLMLGYRGRGAAEGTGWDEGKASMGRWETGLRHRQHLHRSATKAPSPNMCKYL